MTERRRILSIDGGGVRGIIPAIWLAELERVTNKPTREHFDFLAGTSTGAVIAGALAAGIPAQHLVDVYERRGPEIFRRLPVIGQVLRFFTGSLYSVKTLNRILIEELAEHASWILNDVPNDILVTAKRLRDGRPWYFVKDRPGEPAGRTGGLLLADCVTASAAAPTYFGPWDVASIGELVDGGTGVAGNPVYQACVEAFHYNAAKYAVEDTIVVSLGTGRFLDRTRPTWLPSWLTWILSELLRSPGEQQTELVQRHYDRARFYRIDVALKRDFTLDSVNDVAELRAIAEKRLQDIDWWANLDGTDETLLVGPKTVSARHYAKAV